VGDVFPGGAGRTKAQEGLCGHEKVMLRGAALLFASVDAYLLLG